MIRPTAHVPEDIRRCSKAQRIEVGGLKLHRRVGTSRHGELELQGVGEEEASFRGSIGGQHLEIRWILEKTIRRGGVPI